MTRKILHEIRRLAPEAEVSVDGRNHYRLTLPNGFIVTVSGTPSCPRFLRNVRADLRRKTKGKQHVHD